MGSVTMSATVVYTDYQRVGRLYVGMARTHASRNTF